VNACVAGVVSKAGRIDVLINNAGFAYVDLMEAITIEQAKRFLTRNVFWRATHYASGVAADAQQKSGLVMQISSGAGRVVFPCFGIYNASKFALEAMTEAYRYELAECGSIA